MSFTGAYNINDQKNLYGSKRKNIHANLHYNKNHDIFGGGYEAAGNPGEAPSGRRE